MPYFKQSDWIIFCYFRAPVFAWTAGRLALHVAYVTWQCCHSVYLYPWCLHPYYRVYFTNSHTGRHSSQVYKSDIQYLVLPEPLHPLPLGRYNLSIRWHIDIHWDYTKDLGSRQFVSQAKVTIILNWSDMSLRNDCTYTSQTGFSCLAPWVPLESPAIERLALLRILLTQRSWCHAQYFYSLFFYFITYVLFIFQSLTVPIFISMNSNELRAQIISK